jgi:hypothetical protein
MPGSVYARHPKECESVFAFSMPFRRSVGPDQKARSISKQGRLTADASAV